MMGICKTHLSHSGIRIEYGCILGPVGLLYIGYACDKSPGSPKACIFDLMFVYCKVGVSGL